MFAAESKPLRKDWLLHLRRASQRVLYALAVGAARTRSLDDPDADAGVEARKRATALAAHSFLKVRDELRALWLSLRG